MVFLITQFAQPVFNIIIIEYLLRVDRFVRGWLQKKELHYSYHSRKTYWETSSHPYFSRFNKAIKTSRCETITTKVHV